MISESDVDLIAKQIRYLAREMQKVGVSANQLAVELMRLTGQLGVYDRRCVLVEGEWRVVFVLKS